MGLGAQLAPVEPPLPPDPLSAARRAGAGTAPAEGPSDAAREAARAGLYVHVPFCATRCTYCDFATGTLSRPALERWLDAIERDIRVRAETAAGLEWSSVFFGGGTPSVLASRHFRRVMDAISASFRLASGAEITLEANPESVRDPLLETWRAAGVNRLSMGVQTFEPAGLRMLGRIHDGRRPAEAVAQARAHGFERISLDLMFGYPDHDAAAWARTLDRALALEPEHVSAYCFIPEPGTPLGHAVLDGRVGLPAPEAQADLYAQLTERLESAGYAAYETSNFARPAAEARHNLVYWLRRDYLGLGPSAHGLWQGLRYGNHYATGRWAAALERGRACDVHERETASSRADEIVMLGLRLARGLAARDHAPERWSEVEALYGAAFGAALATGRLATTADGVRIPARHRFVADDVIAWLMARADRAGREASQSAPGFDSRATASVT